VGADLRAELGADLGWPDVEAIIGQLATAAADDGLPQAVVGILRGGMIPAVILAHHLGLRDVRGVEVTHTAADGAGAAKTPRPVLRNADSLGDVAALDVVVVDDVAGTGDTLTAAAGLVRAAGARRVRTLVCAVNILNRCDAFGDAATYVGREVRGWVRFPWERC
jgi:hypoxanthine phosphoribosyltransferase